MNMNPSNDIVALLLDDDLPPERLGAMLRAARKRRGMKRSAAAARAGIARDDLRDYERGSLPIPADVCTRLAEAYGDDLTAHIPLRMPVQVEDRWIVAGDQARAHPSGTPDEVLRNYVDVLVRLRGAKPGQPVPLRASDLTALASALGEAPETIEVRIVDLLGCSREEAAQLRRELMRRKIVVPMAGLAAGVALLAAASANAESNPPSGKIVPRTATTAAPSPAEPEWNQVDVQVPDPALPAPTAAPTPAPPPAPAPTPEAAPIPDAPVTDATVPPGQVQEDVPVSIPEGETFVEIGDAITEP